MVATQGVPLRRRISLRLDDGTIISGCQKHAKSEAVVCLRPEQAYESGFLHEADLIKVQSLLCEVHARLPEVGPLRSVSTGTKRSLDSVLEVGSAPGAAPRGLPATYGAIPGSCSCHFTLASPAALCSSTPSLAGLSRCQSASRQPSRTASSLCDALPAGSSCPARSTA